MVEIEIFLTRRQGDLHHLAVLGDTNGSAANVVDESVDFAVDRGERPGSKPMGTPSRWIAFSHLSDPAPRSPEEPPLPPVVPAPLVVPWESDLAAEDEHPPRYDRE